VLYRLYPDSLLLRIATLNQHLHGLHHMWPRIPWYRYRAVVDAIRDELGPLGFEVRGRRPRSRELPTA
jgi:fatty acid desaturase